MANELLISPPSQTSTACLTFLERFNLLTDFDMEEFEFNGRISQMK